MKFDEEYMKSCDPNKLRALFKCLTYNGKAAFDLEKNEHSPEIVRIYNSASSSRRSDIENWIYNFYVPAYFSESIANYFLTGEEDQSYNELVAGCPFVRYLENKRNKIADREKSMSQEFAVIRDNMEFYKNNYKASPRGGRSFRNFCVRGVGDGQ